MIKPFNGDYPMRRGFGGLLIANDAKYGTHKGVDWALPVGTPLLACISGTITYASDATDAGLTVTINSNGNLYKCFHMSRIDVILGQQVIQGQQIGLSGATGNVTGPHLHFQVEIPAGNPVDPLPLLGNVLGKETEDTMQGDTIIKNRKDAKAFYSAVWREGCTDSTADGIIGRSILDITNQWAPLQKFKDQTDRINNPTASEQKLVAIKNALGIGG